MEEDSVVITQGWVLNNHAIQINEDIDAGKTHSYLPCLSFYCVDIMCTVIGEQTANLKIYDN